MHDPASEYKKRLEERRDLMNQCFRRLRINGYARLGVGFLIAMSIWLAVGPRLISGWLILAPLSIFIALLVYDDRLYRTGRRARRAVAYYERGLARIEDRWAGGGNADASLAGESHMYATDLDLFGSGSLFDLLNTARTRAGEKALAGWLTAPAAREETLRRQRAIDELRNNVDLREDLVVLADDVRTAVDPAVLNQWALAPVSLRSVIARATAPFLVLLTIGTFVYWLFDGSADLVRAALAVEIAYGLFHRQRVREVIASIDEPAKELSVLHAALARLDRERFTSDKLRDLRAGIGVSGKTASVEMASLLRLVDYLNYRRNEWFAPFALLLLWATQFTYAIETWRMRSGAKIGPWLDAVGEVEALCALAGYAFEHPGDPFPDLIEGQILLEADDVRHPLIPASECVPNSLKLGGDLRLLVVSGSNMSGKSTLLRTIGINAVLAQAGAPVRAKRFRLSPMAIGATLRVQDSLQGHTSRFYSEIRRLHEIMELTKGPLPVLFLLDEILHGTNSHDRAIGAEAVVRGLVDRSAIGLVTTHDLALAKVADALAPRAANVHFRDHLENGRMIFDYRLHPGVVEKSNALELMRAIGLKV